MEKINSFEGGMTSDNEPAMQPANTYREGWNGNLIAYGENRYSFESVKGNVLSFTIPDHYEQNPYQVIGWLSFIDQLFVLLGSDEDDYKPGEAGVVTFNNSGIGTYTPLYYHEDFGLTKEHPIAHDAIVGKPENQNIRRVVWTDNNKPMRTMNIFDPVFSTHIVSGDLIAGRKYMVLTTDAVSYITHDGNDWGPGRAGDGNSQNIFTAVSGTYTSTGTGYKVIEYVTIESLSVILDFAPGSIYYKGWVGGGSLLAGTYQYFYQLESSDGARTNWSYLSSPMYAVTNEFPTDQSISYAKFFSIPTTSNTNKGIKLTIDNIDFDTYKKIRVGYVRCTALNVYESPKIFYSDVVADSFVDLIHYGNETILETLTLNDITTPLAVLDLVKSITSTKNILFAGNIGLANDPLFNLSADVRCKTIEYLLPSDLLHTTPDDTNNIAAGYAICGHGQLQDAVTGNAVAYPNQWYEVVDGNVSNYCTYNSIDYYEGGPNGKFFKGIPGTTAITNTGDARAVAVIRIQKYTSPTTAEDGNYKNIRIENDFADFKSPLISHYLKSQWRGEEYSYGLFVYGTKGQQNFVTHLINKVIPEQYKTSSDTEFIDDAQGVTSTIGFNMRTCENASSTASLRSIGLSFSDIDFNIIADAYGCEIDELDQFVKGFSIVRLERDAQAISQGVIWPVMVNRIVPILLQISGVDYLDSDYNNDADPTFGRKQNYYMYYSPDDLSTLNDGIPRPSVANGDLLKIVNMYESLYESLGVSIDLGSHNFYSKFYTQFADPDTGNLYKKGDTTLIDFSNTVNMRYGLEDQELPGTTLFFSNVGLATAASRAGDGAVRKCYGTTGVLVNTKASESTSIYGIGYIDDTHSHKTIVNWTRPKSNIYGKSANAYSESTRATYKYIFAGHYQPLDSAFMTYMTGTSDATPSAPSQTKVAGIVNNVEVFGGDTYVSMFALARTYPKLGEANNFGNGCVVPIESNINENWRGYHAPADTISGQGRTFNKDRIYDSIIALFGVNYQVSGGGFTELFTFFTAFLGRERQYYFLARLLNFLGSIRDESLILRSLEKIDGEIIDNWRIFLLSNQKRVDSEYGPINNIRAKSSRLFYWQNKGVGYIPIYEREMNSTSVGDAVQMGVGGIMDRFDEIDFFHGNQHQMSLFETDEEFGWFDFRRKKVLRMSFGGGKQILSEVKGMDAFFQVLFDDIEAEAGETIFNSDNPLTGKGIISCYDSRFKLGLMVFKYTRTISGKEYEQDFAIGFSKNLDKYVGFFNIRPNHIISHNGNFLMTKQIRTGVDASTAYGIGDELIDGTNGFNYVCILPYTSPALKQEPNADSTHWALSSKSNQVYVSWRGDICKFFGIVYPWSITSILQGEHLAVDGVEVGGNNTWFSDVFIENGSGLASDETIAVSNRNYEYFDGSWQFSLPLKNKLSKLVDNYLQVKLQTKNYSGTSITTSLNLVKRVFYIKQIGRNRK